MWFFYLLWHVWAISECRLAKKQKQNKKKAKAETPLSPSLDFRTMNIGLTT